MTAGRSRSAAFAGALWNTLVAASALDLVYTFVAPSGGGGRPAFLWAVAAGMVLAGALERRLRRGGSPWLRVLAFGGIIGVWATGLTWCVGSHLSSAMACAMAGVAGVGIGLLLADAMVASPAAVVIGVLAGLAGAAAAVPAMGWWPVLLIAGCIAAIPPGPALRAAVSPVEVPPARSCRVLCAFAAVFAAAVPACSWALCRPWIAQHLPASPRAAVAADAVIVVALAGGAFLRRSVLRRTGVAVTVGIAGLVLGWWLLIAWLASWRFGMSASGTWFITEHASPIWSALMIGWAVYGLPGLGAGILFASVRGTQWTPFVLAVGIAAGVTVGEALLGTDQEAVRGIRSRLVRALARQEPLAPPIAGALDADGVRTRAHARIGTESEVVDAWNGTTLSRGRSWDRLARVERDVLLAIEKTSGSTIVLSPGAGAVPVAWPEAGWDLTHPPGHAAVFAAGEPADGRLPWSETWRALGDRGNSGALFVPSLPAIRAGWGRIWTDEALTALLRGPAVVCCDPRALGAEELRAVLATVRRAAPSATFTILTDGYAGPLLLVSSAPPEVLSSSAPFTLVTGAVQALLRADLGPVLSVDRGGLDGFAAVRPSPFSHPRGDVLRALKDALVLTPLSPPERVLEGLARHAEAQGERTWVVSAWDHVAMPKEEIAVYLDAFRHAPADPLLVRQLGAAADVLLMKREFGVLVPLAEEVVAWLPDEGPFHWILGRGYHGILDLPAAIDELETAWRLRQDVREIAEELSRVYAESGRWDQAVRVLEQAFQLHPEPSVAKGLGLALVETGRFERAREVLEPLARLAGGDPDIGRALAQIREHAASRPR